MAIFISFSFHEAARRDEDVEEGRKAGNGCPLSPGTSREPLKEFYTAETP
jgi:hypothetical protein